jgi:hypothetical protein
MGVGDRACMRSMGSDRNMLLSLPGDYTAAHVTEPAEVARLKRGWDIDHTTHDTVRAMGGLHRQCCLKVCSTWLRHMIRIWLPPTRYT